MEMKKIERYWKIACKEEIEKTMDIGEKMTIWIICKIGKLGNLWKI